MNRHHPFVSERHEGKPWFEWCVCVALVMIVAQLLSNRSAGKDGSDDVAEAAMVEDQTANDTDIPSVEDEVATTALTGTQADADYSVIEQEDAQGAG